MRPFAVAALIVLAPLAVRADADEELDRFQGDWQVVKITHKGKTLTKEQLGDKVWRFKGNKLIPLDNKDDVATIAVDPDKKPATLDITDKNGSVNKCIYKFSGEDESKLTICAATGGGARPKSFTPDDEDKVAVVVLEKLKKK
jgi:uncharacterized protein (TIGR03067 family)